MVQISYFETYNFNPQVQKSRLAEAFARNKGRSPSFTRVVMQILKIQ